MASERVVKVTLTAQMQNYLQGMEKARKVTADAASEAQKLAETKRQFDLLGRSVLAAGGLVAVGLGVAVARAAQFDQAMSNVAATGEDARKNLDALREAAIDAGASTVYSAEESAGAIENLAKAGLSAADILGGALSGSLDLAAAGGLAVADAAEIAATTLQQFGLNGSDAVRVADLLAAGAGKAMGDVSDMSQALKQAGLVANQFGIPVEEATGTLAAFASAGLLGSDAGTSFRTMLLRLANPTDEVKGLMKQLGIETYNAQGQFIGLEGLAGELETGLAGLTDQQKQSALATIFGQDAIRAATVLYEEGADGIAEWTEKVDDAGYAAETAETKLDNLKGDIEALQGAVDSALISMGSAADGPLRSFVQLLTGVVDTFNDMPAAGQQAVFWLGAAGAAALTAYGSYLLLVPKVAEYNAALEVLGPTAQKTSRALGLVAKTGGGVLAGLAGGAIAADLLIDAFNNAGLSGEELANKIKTATDAVALFDAQQQKTFVGSSNVKLAQAQIESLGGALDALRKGTKGDLVDIKAIMNVQRLGKDLGDLADDDLPSAQKQFRLLAESADLSEQQQSQLLDIMEPYKNALTEQATAAGTAADGQALLDLAMGDAEESTAANEDAMRALAGQSALTGEEIDGLAEKIRGFGSATLSTRDAQRQFEQAVDDLSASIEANGATLDVNTQEGRENQAALDDIAKSTLELAASTYEQTGSQDEATKVMETGRQKLIEMLGQFGITGQAAEDYADELDLIPENVKTAVALDTANAEARIQAFITSYNGRTIKLGVSAETIVGNPSMGGGALPRRAGGGAIYGPGTGTSDSVPFLGSNGEHVLTADDVRAMGGQHAVYGFRAGLHGGGSAGGNTSVSLTPSGPIELADQSIQKLSAEIYTLIMTGAQKTTLAALGG